MLLGWLEIYASVDSTFTVRSYNTEEAIFARHQLSATEIYARNATVKQQHWRQTITTTKKLDNNKNKFGQQPPLSFATTKTIFTTRTFFV